MLGMTKITVNRRVLFALIGALLALMFLGYQAVPTKPDLPPREAFAKALNVTMNTASYRYKLEMKTVQGGKSEILSAVNGDKAAANRIHIWGEMLQSPVDFYQLNSTSYKKDETTGEWLKFEENELNMADIFLVEINPFSNLAYKELKEVSFTGNVKIGNKEYWQYLAKPIISNPSQEALWRDFTYKIFVDEEYRIYKAVVEAISKNNAGYKLLLTMDFWDFDKNIEIKPPVN